MNIKICITAWRRPYYFKEVIEALEKCMGINNYSILISVDWCGDIKKQEEHKTIFDGGGLKKLPHEIHLHPKRMGCAGNVGFAFKTAFEDPTIDAVIMLEDDTLPSEDFLNYSSTLLDRYKNDDNVLNISGYVRNGRKADPNKIISRKWFTSQGWSTWRRIYEEIGPNWFGIHWKNNRKKGEKLPSDERFFKYVKKSNTGSWGIPMNKYWRKDRVEIGPGVSRIQNIGAKEGMFNPDEKWHKKNIHVEAWMGDEKYFDVKKYYEYKLFKKGHKKLVN